MKRGGVPADRPRAGKRQHVDDGEVQLDTSVLGQMADFLDSEGGNVDFDTFLGAFPGVKKRQLEPHFRFDAQPKNRWLIGLPDAPGSSAQVDDEQTSSGRGNSKNSRGTIVRYDEGKGFGFIVDESSNQDIFFLRSELPAPLEGRGKEQLINTKVDFEVITMPDGKLRAKRLVLAGASRPGRIRSYDRSKGYGFIEITGEQDVFFLRSSLPKELAEGSGKIEGLEVFCEPYVSEEGKRRSKTVVMAQKTGFVPIPFGLAPMAPFPRPAMGVPPMPFMPAQFVSAMAQVMSGRKMEGDDVRIGTIISYDTGKGFGFIKANGLSEDVYFQKAELPLELRDASSKEQVVNQRVDFELTKTVDGKLRAKRILLAPAAPPPGPRRGNPGGVPGGSGSRAVRRTVGKIVKYEKSKGYGFISVVGQKENVFFMRSNLPQDLGDEGIETLQNLDVSFEMYRNEDKKLRANALELVTEKTAANAQQDKVSRGLIVRFDAGKGYGFIKPDHMTEDVFFLKSELPAELDPANQEVRDQRVEFEIKTMPDGKLRALHLHLIEGDEPELRDNDEDMPDEGPMGDEAEPDQAEAEQLEPAIALVKGCMPSGVIKSYDPAKGFGFLRCDGMEQDIFFPHTALAVPFQARQAKGMPNLAGVEVSFALEDSGPGGDFGDRGPRATQVDLLLRYHPIDRCWLLRRMAED